MKKQNKLSVRVRDLEPLKDVVGGRRHRRHALHAREARAFNPLVTHCTLGKRGLSIHSSANTEAAWA